MKTFKEFLNETSVAGTGVGEYKPKLFSDCQNKECKHFKDKSKVTCSECKKMQ
jgi:hypothetical protein